MDLTADPAQRAALKLIVSRQSIARPFATPPGVPAERLAALRAAFDATLKDADFLAEARTADLDVRPVTGAAVEALIKEIYASPSEAIKLRPRRCRRSPKLPSPTMAGRGTARSGVEGAPASKLRRRCKANEASTLRRFGLANADRDRGDGVRGSARLSSGNVRRTLALCNQLPLRIRRLWQPSVPSLAAVHNQFGAKAPIDPVLKRLVS